jgi:hypothetical protein
VWDFSLLDAVTQPRLHVGDTKPEFQIATAPTFMNGSATFNSDFASYASELVSYYNSGGFDVGTTHYQSASANPIKLWGIYNEPHLNQLNASQYTAPYNTVVPAMQAVDPNLHFVAVELSDAGTAEQDFLPTFAANVTAQVWRLTSTPAAIRRTSTSRSSIPFPDSVQESRTSIRSSTHRRRTPCSTRCRFGGRRTTSTPTLPTRARYEHL